MRRHPVFPLLFGLLPALLTAQSTVHPGTTLHVLGGATVRLPDGLTLTVPSGAAVVNDGLIDLAPTAAIAEASGSPLTGLGVEHINVWVTSPPAALEPGGLGFRITSTNALDSLSIERGHTILSDTSGSSGIARWYRVRPQVNNGLAAEIGFRYDLTELQGIAEADLMLYTAQQGDSIWLGIPSAVDLPLSTVFATWLDSLGTYTLFDGSLGTTTSEEAVPAELSAGPNPTTDVLEVRDTARGFRSLAVLDAMGRTVLHQDLTGHRTHHRLPVSDLAPGTYLLRTDDGRSLRFTRP
ncbi:MAG: T9SS type A sorting domain-containing protein [Flavobacteriales bacterium]|nr:T9SS type A sorting domain-containing protein [Flavobacteriales bacterium]